MTTQASIIFEQLEASALAGRGGASYPTHLKWRAVATAVAEHPEHRSFVVCNGAEGEPGFFKDAYIIEHYPEKLIAGIKIALDTFKSEQAFIYLKKPYYKKYYKRLMTIIKDVHLPITLFAETGGYLCGEETTLLETLEGRRAEPRLRPPYPTAVGYQNCPTLVMNVETFYNVYLVAKSEYSKQRFFSISGAVKHPGVYQFPESYTVKQVLEETGNTPSFKYFVQVGGGAAGTIYTQKEANTVSGASIIVYDYAKTDKVKLMKTWINFFHQENCGKCTPCREGVRRIKDLLAKPIIDYKEIKSILLVMRDTSFCPLGKSVYFPFSSLLEKIK